MSERVREYREVLDRIKFRDWAFWTHDHMVGSERSTYLQVEFSAPDPSVTPEIGAPPGHGHTRQKGRKWLLSPHMTDGEIAQTALMAVVAAMEHEIREEFTYRGHPIFGPHYDLEVLVAVCDSGHGDIRRAPLEAGRFPQGLRERDIEPKDPYRRER